MHDGYVIMVVGNNIDLTSLLLGPSYFWLFGKMHCWIYFHVVLSLLLVRSFILALLKWFLYSQSLLSEENYSSCFVRIWTSPCQKRIWTSQATTTLIVNYVFDMFLY